MFLSLTIALLAGQARADLGPSSEVPLAIVDVTVIPMSADADAGLVLEHQVVLVRAGRIVSIGPAAEVALPPDAKVVDGQGRFLLPGLVDAHTHTLSAEDFHLHLAAGVTTVLEMSGNPQQLAWRAEIEAGRRRGPRLFVVGPQLKTSAIPMVDMELAVTTPDEARRVVEGIAADGYDFVKVWGALAPDVFESVSRTADRVGIRIVGHIPESVGLAASLAGGMAAVAHVEEYWDRVLDGRADEERLAQAVEVTQKAGAAVVTTLVTYENMARVLESDLGGLLERPELRYIDPVRQLLWGPDFNAYRRRFDAAFGARLTAALEQKQHIARTLHKAGVPLLAGSDAGGIELSLIPGSALHRELELLIGAGLTSAEALRAATSAPGRFLSPADPFGVIAPGLRADLVLLDADPLADIRNLARVAGIVAAGRWIDRAELDGDLAALALRNAGMQPIASALIEGGADAVMQAYERAEGESPESFVLQETPAVLLGLLMFQLGRKADALAVLELATNVIPDGYGAWYFLGVALRSSGDRQGARACLEAVLERCPTHRQAQEALADLAR